MKMKKKDTLIALLKEKADLGIAKNQCWYRIPVKTKQTPLMVRDDKVKYMAFYQTSKFEEKAFRIEYYGKVKNISVVKRKELFRGEPLTPDSEKKYYKIEFEKLLNLPNPKLNQKHRPIRLFVTTIFDKLYHAKTFNDIFYESPLEEKFWEALKAKKIPAERQFVLHSKRKTYYLDFAVFAEKLNLDLECDGKRYHSKEDDLLRDSKRNHELIGQGWQVLRFRTSEIENQLDYCMQKVKEAAKRYGPLNEVDDFTNYKLFSSDGSNQLSLFE
jgi:very-short-patch-repair endonuclease